MNATRKFVPSFYARHDREIKEGAIMAVLVVFAAAYAALPSFKQVVDMGVTPAVAGVTMLYGKVTTLVHKHTGYDFGFVVPTPDPDFVFDVRLATYINERRAGPLLDIAGDTQYPEEKRERALAAILKFETSSEWIQPFLNELPKGGLLGLYSEESPLLDDLIRKIRAEGGVRQPMIRAYAEVVFSFMLQVPDVVVRRHACKWLSDVVAEDAVFLLVPRIEKEKDPKGQQAIDEAFYGIRAVSEPDNAREMLIPFYRNPPWPSLKLPLSIVLARLGYDVPVPYIDRALKSDTLSGNERVMMLLAVSRTPYARQLKITENEERLMAERKETRAAQMRLALERRERIFKQEEMRRAAIERASAEKPQDVVAAAAQPEVQTETARQASVPEQPKVASKPATAPKTMEKKPPKQFTVPGSANVETPAESVQVASLPKQPEKVLLPPIEEGLPKARSLMNSVDAVFEVKKQDAPLFQDPGENASGVELPVGTKGTADFEFLIGEDHWFQVKSKKGSGWVNGKYLTLFRLNPATETPVAAKKSDGDMDGSRNESTYFEGAVEDVAIYEKANEKSKRIGTLAPEVAYRAVKSEKVGADRWFLLQIRTGETAWARGLDLRLSSVQKHADPDAVSSDAMPSSKESAFKAEWVTPSVKGVGVYSRASIAGKMLRQINPSEVYKVLESSDDWYRIQLSGSSDGWVQSMDVSLTKKN